MRLFYIKRANYKEKARCYILVWARSAVEKVDNSLYCKQPLKQEPLPVAARTPVPNTVTQLLLSDETNGYDLTDRLVPLVYDELRVMAHRHLAGERRGLPDRAAALLQPD